MDDLLSIIVTCTPYPRILTLFIMAPWGIVRYVVLTLWLQVQVQVWFSIPVIVPVSYTHLTLPTICSV